ncbi:MAG: hypothetical protein AB1544_11690, partial [Pseudomonadota bacterium]
AGVDGLVARHGGLLIQSALDSCLPFWFTAQCRDEQTFSTPSLAPWICSTFANWEVTNEQKADALA